MKKIEMVGCLEIVKRGRTHMTYELRNGGKCQATFKSLPDLYASVDRREQQIKRILADPRLV